MTDGAPAGQTDPSEGDSKYSIPVHLAPKQRELVLRIQQKQRERDASVTVHQNTNGEQGASLVLPSEEPPIGVGVFPLSVVSLQLIYFSHL